MGLLVRLTYHMPDLDDLLTSSSVIPSLTTLRQVAAKVSMHPSSHSCHIDMISPDCRWGNMWAVWNAWVKRGFRLRSDL